MEHEVIPEREYSTEIIPIAYTHAILKSDVLVCSKACLKARLTRIFGWG